MTKEEKINARRFFGKFVAECRDLAEKTQAKVAAEVGWGTQFLSNIERGVAGCPLEKVPALAKAIKCKPKDLFEVWEKVVLLENRERWKTIRRAS